ncbi:cellulase family glycosylhydrolase [Vibrio sp. 10N.286.52.B1]|uniref:cellulase family glycosylhydrolase n=1 Tax=Vibrio sp. 10N.286.52.B1 TaxID=3229712 RepID=UPI00354BC302
MKLFKLSLIAMSTALVLGCDSGYYNNDETVVPGEPAREIPTGSGTSANRLTVDGTEFYVNGANIAWMYYANDFGKGFDETQARSLMKEVAAAGGNTVRWWVHTNGTTTPAWGTDGLVADETSQATAIADIKQALQAAEDEGVKIIFSLWSFDMLRGDQSGVPDVADNNYALLSDATVRQSYVDNFLMPLVTAIKAEPALLALEIFNEPENMLESWANPTHTVTMDEIYTTTAVLAAAIHNEAPDVMVTTGPKSLGMYFNNTGNNDGGSYAYSDTQMDYYLNQGYPEGLPEGYSADMARLDFYAPHYYDDLGKEGNWSPFYHNISYWELTKPVIIGEFFVDNGNDEGKPAEFTYFNDPLSEEELCGRLVSTDYAGGLGWQLSGNGGKYGDSVISCIETAKAALGNGGEEPEDPEGLIDFEDGDISGFTTHADGAEGQTLVLHTADASSGSHSLALQMVKPEGEKKAYITFPTDIVATVTKVTMQIKFPAGADAAAINGGKFYAKDASWNWVEGTWYSVAAGAGWAEISWTPETPITSPQEFGFQIYGDDGGAAFTGDFLIDDVLIE